MFVLVTLDGMPLLGVTCNKDLGLDSRMDYKGTTPFIILIL